MKRMRQVFSIMFIMLLIISMIPVKPIHAEQVEDNRPTVDVKKTTVEPIIDGAIDESFWTVDEPLSVELGNGNFQDATFGMLWDQKYLYVAIDIEDEALIHDGSGHWFEQDDVCFFRSDVAPVISLSK